MVAPFGPHWEIERYRLGGLPRNFSEDPALEERLHEAIRSGRSKVIRAISAENRATGGCTGHMSASAVKDRVSQDFWESALKFASERHPYEKAVSLAHFQFRGEPDAFSAHLDAVVQHGKYHGHPVYTMNGEPVVDDWVLMNSLESDLDRIAERLGLPTPLAVPRARARTRADRTPAAEVLTTRQKRIVQNHCAPEFELFGWER